jgi:phosphate transport system protein
MIEGKEQIHDGPHLRAVYDQEYAAIENDLLKMTGLVDQAIERASNSLNRRNQALAKEVIQRDEEINELRFKIEESCLRLIATQQPTASDLRAVVSAMNIVVDLERMGDHAAGIAKTVILMGDEPLLKPLIDIPKMVKLGRKMLREVINAFIHRDAEKAREIASQDEAMDQLYKAIFDELVEIMANRHATVARATYLMWCAHNLERIADRVTNIAERVIFITTGDMKELNV